MPHLSAPPPTPGGSRVSEVERPYTLEDAVSIGSSSPSSEESDASPYGTGYSQTIKNLSGYLRQKIERDDNPDGGSSDQQQATERSSEEEEYLRIANYLICAFCGEPSEVCPDSSCLSLMEARQDMLESDYMDVHGVSRVFPATEEASQPTLTSSGERMIDAERNEIERPSVNEIPWFCGQESHPAPSTQYDAPTQDNDRSSCANEIGVETFASDPWQPIAAIRNLRSQETEGESSGGASLASSMLSAPEVPSAESATTSTETFSSEHSPIRGRQNLKDTTVADLERRLDDNTITTNESSRSTSTSSGYADESGSSGAPARHKRSAKRASSPACGPSVLSLAKMAASVTTQPSLQHAKPTRSGDQLKRKRRRPSSLSEEAISRDRLTQTEESAEVVPSS